MQILNEGQKFGRYRVDRHLGSGISGESYEAEDTMLHRKVTLKLIHPWSTLPDAARRQFFREIQSMSVLTHANLAAILDYGEVNAQLYIARRFVDSGSLLGHEGRLWFHPPLDLVQAIHLIHQVSQTLHYIHDAGYVHGSLTFSNLLILHDPNQDDGADSTPLLLADIGLAHFVRRYAKSPIAPLSITAAPEQSEKCVLPASDQYALAVLLYFWLTGFPPFFGSPQEIEQLKLTETINSLVSLNSTVTTEQEEILHRALSASPEKRYPSTIAFTQALLASLHHSTFPIFPKTSTHVSSPPKPEPARQTESTPELQPILQASTPLSLPSPEPLPQSLPDISYPIPQSPAFAFPNVPEMPLHPEPSLPTISAYLVITPPNAIDSYEVILEREETTLGRAGSSDILLDQDTWTSRHHALLKRKRDCYMIYDQRSANGVAVNEQKLENENGYILADGDVISIGDYKLTFHLISTL